MATYAGKVVDDTKMRSGIIREVERIRQVYFERDRVMHEIRRQRLLRHRTNMPKAYQNVIGGKRALKLPIMYRLIQTAVASVMKKRPTVYVEPLAAADKRAAEDMARADNLLIQTIENSAVSGFLYKGAFTLMGDGLVVIKTTPGAWAGFPIPPDQYDTADDIKLYNDRVAHFMAEHPLPFYTRVVDPLTFYPPMGEYGEGVYVESAWRSTREVMHSLCLCPSADGRDLVPMDPEYIPSARPFPELELPVSYPSSVRTDEIWTKDYCAVSINRGAKIIIFENTLGDVPYDFGYADPTGVGDPTNVGMSIGFPLYWLTPWIDTIMGITAAWALWAPPTVYTTQDPIPGQRNTGETRVEALQLGKLYHFPPGKKPGVLNPPPVGQNLLGLLSFLIEASDRGGLPAIASGGGLGTRMPALTFQSATEAGAGRLIPAKESFERVLAGMLMKVHKIIGRYDTPVRVNGWEYTASGDPKTRRWASIYPDEARKGRRVQVSISMDSTQDSIAKGTHAQFMVSAGLWDVERGMRYSGVENPQETMDKIAADTARRAALPLVAQAILAEDPDIAKQMATAAASQAGGGGQPTPETPTAAGPEQPLAQPLEQPNPAAAPLGAPPGPGRNRANVPAGRGGGSRGRATVRPRGNRGGTGGAYGRT